MVPRFVQVVDGAVAGGLVEDVVVVVTVDRVGVLARRLFRGWEHQGGNSIA